GEVEDDERGDDEEKERGEGVARAELEEEVLPRQRGHVAGVAAHAASSRRALANRSTRSGSWVATTSVAAPARPASSSSTRAAAWASRLVNGSSRSRRRGSCRRVRQSARRWLIPREKLPTRSCRTSHRRKRSSSIPIRSRRSDT